MAPVPPETSGEKPPPGLLIHGINMHGVALSLQLLTPHGVVVPILHVSHLSMMESVIYLDWECTGEPKE